MDVDIIIPVWNRPVETRSCLVDLIKHSPQARFIMVDNGSDEETESLLEEFSDILAERALFLRSGLNHGFVKAANRGLTMATAPSIVVLRSTTMVTAGWLDPMLRLAAKKSEAGIVVPRLVSAGEKGKSSVEPVEETLHGHFAALFLKKAVYDAVGPFDEELDGGILCLKDYSHRAYRAGFLTFVTEASPVYYRDEVALGSDARREEMLRRSKREFHSRWGDEKTFCVYFPNHTTYQAAQPRLDIILRGARQGHRFVVLVHRSLYSDLERVGSLYLHRSIKVEALPYLFSDSAVKKRYQQMRSETPEARMVPGIDGIPFPGVTGTMTFSELEKYVKSVEKERYARP